MTKLKRVGNGVRVRIAPSPTGYLHLGTARAALYNWLFARNRKGKFILRIEDTDIARSSKEMVKSIIDGLSWLGIDWDEGPIFQSERLEVYRKYANKLHKEGKAYYCYCSPEELAERRETARKKKEDWKYDRRCLHLNNDTKEKYEKEGRPKALRFLVPEGTTSFLDIIHGEIKKKNDEIEDFVIFKSDGTPTYNLAVVVDDFEMEISHNIRGEDHIPNTPKQLMLCEALGLNPPAYAHLPLILGEDRSKLSKRHGAVSVTEYKGMGFLHEALFNFLALLGWSPGEDRELMSKKEIIENFNLDRISKKAAIFDIEKLEWMNGVYINEMNDDDLVQRVIPFLTKKGWLEQNTIDIRMDYVVRFVNVLKKRMRKLTDFVKYGSYFFEDVNEYEEKGVKKHFTKESINYIKAILNMFEKNDDFSKAYLEDVFRHLSEQLAVKPAKLIHPVRLAVTGMTVGPGLFELLEVLGKKIVINRLTKALKYIRISYNESNGAIV